jgi:hypothetical protein
MSDDIFDCIGNASKWLKRIQNKKDGGWGEYKGNDSNCLNTAEAILALVRSGCNTAGDQIIQDGVKFLCDNQIKKQNKIGKKNCGSWPRMATRGKNIIRIPDTVRTSCALLACNTAGISSTHTAVKEGVNWLLQTQNKKTHGWGYSPNQENQLFPTCMALRALMQICQSSNTRTNDLIQKGLDHLKSYRNDDGSYGLAHGLEVSHTLYVIQTYSMAYELGFTVPSGAIKDATYWIQQHKKDALRWSTETILLKPDPKSSHNFTFSHINPALYLEVVDKNIREEDDIASDALIAIHDNMDVPTHAFCAKRPVSWATAKTLLGLTPARQIFHDFPQSPKSVPLKLGLKHYLLFALTAFVLISAVLAALNRLNVTFASILFLVILAILLIYGYISERSFVRLLLERKKTRKEIGSP